MSYDIDTAGKTTSSNVIKSIGSPVPDEAVHEGIANCSFTLALADGIPVNSTFKMQYV
ncbi:hypothetical protein [Janthinobacterium agaricidamnosum]|uniref:energy transducer TonB n=1 Tax=Janthinobacterium agaricidamnosum TaxID=55508 RepID=UPI00142F36A3